MTQQRSCGLSRHVHLQYNWIDDDAAAILWAKQACPPAIQLVERLLKTPINAHFQATGEIPDGAHLEPERDVFRIS
jgi:hypothetical protein